MDSDGSVPEPEVERVRSSFPVVDGGERVSNRVATELLGETSTGSGVEQDEVLGGEDPSGYDIVHRLVHLRGGVNADGADGFVTGSVVVRVRSAAGVPDDTDAAGDHALVEDGGPVGDNCPRAGELVRKSSSSDRRDAQGLEPFRSAQRELGVGEEDGTVSCTSQTCGQLKPGPVEIVEKPDGARIGLQSMCDLRVPGGGQQDAVPLLSQQAVKVVMAGKSSAPDLSVGERVGGVVRGKTRLLGCGGAYDDVQADTVEPAPHVAHGHAVLEEDDALIGARARAGEPMFDEGVADIGQEDGLSTGPGGVEARTGGVDEDEAVLREPVPVRAGAFDDEDVTDAGGVGTGMAVQRLGVVTGAVVAVHV